MRRTNQLSIQRMYGYGGQDTAARLGRREIVSQWERALLFRNGALIRTLGPGAHRHWAGGYSLDASTYDPGSFRCPPRRSPPPTASRSR